MYIYRFLDETGLSIFTEVISTNNQKLIGLIDVVFLPSSLFILFFLRMVYYGGWGDKEQARRK
jgi:hypothetical protein